MDAFKFKVPEIDWDKIFGVKNGFEPCNADCECTETCASDDKEELRLALADAAIALADATRTLSDLIDRMYGEV